MSTGPFNRPVTDGFLMALSVIDYARGFPIGSTTADELEPILRDVAEGRLSFITMRAAQRLGHDPRQPIPSGLFSEGQSMMLAQFAIQEREKARRILEGLEILNQ